MAGNGAIEARRRSQVKDMVAVGGMLFVQFFQTLRYRSVRSWILIVSGVIGASTDEGVQFRISSVSRTVRDGAVNFSLEGFVCHLGSGGPQDEEITRQKIPFEEIE